MSRRKQAAINAAVAHAAEKQTSAGSAKDWLRKLPKPKVLAVIGLSALLSLGVLGATVSAGGNGDNSNGKSNQSWLANLFASAPSATTAAANPAPLPTPLPSPQLSKENIYAGSRLLASEDAGAPSSSIQPSDLVIWRKSAGTWYIKDSGNGSYLFNSFGGGSDAAAPGDFDGDGLIDFSVYRPDTPTTGSATWYIQTGSQAGTSNFTSIQFGLNSDIPVPADYDGDGRADFAVWRSSAASFYILNSSTGLFQTVSIGQSGDTPVPADYDGDGRADPAVYRSSNYNWIIYQSSNNQTNTQVFGQSGDAPAPGDFDGDGKVDLAVMRTSANGWVYRPVSGSTATTIAFTGGFSMSSSDTPVQGDYDGDGKTDPAVWRDSTGYWFIQQSTTNTLRQDQWGMSGDTPIAAPMKR